MILLAFVVSVFSLTNWEKSESLIKEVNNRQSSWVAGHNKFSDWSFDEKRKMTGCIISSNRRSNYPIQRERIPSISSDLPDHYDPRIEYPDCKSISRIMNQEECGSCWAFAGTESLSDRFCIQKNIHVQLSPQDLVSCDSYDYGCGGGDLETEWTYMKETGVVSWDCQPYISGNGTTTSCPVDCANGSPRANDKYFAKSFKHVAWFPFRRSESIEKEIVDHGPVEVAFTVYEDFMHYSSGVYSHVSGEALGGHAVKNIGYGATNSTGEKYWIMANSWGESWGLNGFFWIKRGVNECGIESQCYAGEPGNHP